MNPPNNASDCAFAALRLREEESAAVTRAAAEQNDSLLSLDKVLFEAEHFTYLAGSVVLSNAEFAALWAPAWQKAASKVADSMEAVSLEDLGVPDDPAFVIAWSTFERALSGATEEEIASQLAQNLDQLERLSGERSCSVLSGALRGIFRYLRRYIASQSGAPEQSKPATLPDELEQACSRAAPEPSADKFAVFIEGLIALKAPTSLGKKKSGRGRPRDQDDEMMRLVWSLRQSGNFPMNKDIAREAGISCEEVGRILDLRRKRDERAKARCSASDKIAG